MVPLQFGIPGGPEILIFFLLYLTIPFVLAYWVYNDAKEHKKDNGTWWALFVLIVTFGTLIGGFLAVWVYTLKRDQNKPMANNPPSR